MKLVTNKRQLLGLVGAVALGLTMVGPVMAADNSGTSATLTGGELSVLSVAAADFAGADLVLDGAAGTVTAGLTFTNADARGSGLGWTVTAQASQFDGAVGTNALAASSLSVTAPTATAVGTSGPAPTVASGPFVIDTVGAVTVATAAVGDGMGTYDFASSVMSLSLPADVHADVYSSIVTITVATTV